MLWIRRQVLKVLHRYMTPIPKDIAKKWHLRLTYTYVGLCMCTFTMALYMYKSEQLKKKPQLPIRKEHQLIHDLNLGTTTILTISKEGIEKEVYVPKPHFVTD